VLLILDAVALDGTLAALSRRITNRRRFRLQTRPQV
jgi:hypothetical protein